MKVKIDKISDNKVNYKTKIPLVGEMVHEPVVGSSFIVFGGEHDGLVTSIVRELMTTPNGWMFQTMNSRYQVTIMEDQND